MTNDAGWVPEIQQRIRIIIDEAGRTRDWATSVGLLPSQIEKMLEPYGEMLESLHTDDLQLARLLDEADFVIGIEGEFYKYRGAPISTLVSILENTKRQVLGIARVRNGVSKKRLPKVYEPNLYGLAAGSLYIGFTAPTGEKGSLFEDDDPLSVAIKEAFKTLGTASELISQHKDLDEIAERIPDPAVRDIAIQAVQQLSPSSRSGADRVFIAGKNVEGRRVELTRDDKAYAREIVKKPRKTSKFTTYRGKIREIDLDQRRFEMREVEAINFNVRCVYSQSFDSMARNWLDRNVTVSGQCEFDQEGNPRLLFVESVRVLSEGNTQLLFN